MMDGQLDIFTLGKPTAIPPDARVEMGCCWIRDNWRTFKLFISIAHRQVDLGNPCLKRGDVYLLAMQAGMDVTLCRELRRDNNLWSVVARYMVMLQPRLARTLNLRDADVDTVDLVRVWHRVVSSETVFYANDWREAKRLCEIEDVTAL